MDRVTHLANVTAEGEDCYFRKANVTEAEELGETNRRGEKSLIKMMVW